MKPLRLRLAPGARLAGVLLLCVVSFRPVLASVPASPVPIAASYFPPEGSSITILLDDFRPQPYQGQSSYIFNRLDGDRGALLAEADWGAGLVTATLGPGSSLGGVWMSLNHPNIEGIPVNFSAILPTQILTGYQSRIDGITVDIAGGSPGTVFRMELKNLAQVSWSRTVTLDGGPQSLSYVLPPLGDITHFVWVMDNGTPGDFVVMDRVVFSATTDIADVATRAFVWSFGMLLSNQSPATGLVRDKARDRSGVFDAIQATGGLAAASAVAEQLGIIQRSDAIQIVTQISNSLLSLPDSHGLWPHWVSTTLTGTYTIVSGTEWSSVDTVIAAVALLDAQNALGIDSSGSRSMLQAVDWDDLRLPAGIGHGYRIDGARLPGAWDTFGGESWLVELAYAGATGQVAPMAYPSPPTADGSGFIDELAWLFVPPPSTPDYWGTNWSAYRQAAVYSQTSYYPDHYPLSCLSQRSLFGLSAAEVPVPSKVGPNSVYTAFGVGGRHAPANDGSVALGVPVAIPHYAAMIASLRPTDAISMWAWLINDGHFSPLNNVESLMFPAGSDCETAAMDWNHLKGSWNLTLQTLGWGRYLALRNGATPILWRSALADPLLRAGYRLLVPAAPAYLPVALR